MFSIEVTGDGCCGGTYTFLASTYFMNGGVLFDWGMTHIEATMPVNTDLFLKTEVEVDTAGVDHLGIGISVSW